MKFIETQIAGVWIVELERLGDDRGFFARSFCTEEFAAHGIDTAVVQCNISFNDKAATIRGLHYQAPPAAEGKLVRCTSGAIYDVAVDVRPESPTYLHHVAVELTADNRIALFVPELFAHGFQTLADNTEVFYLVSEFYAPEQELGIRWNDPKFKIAWPIEPAHISRKDASWPDFDPRFHRVEQLRGL